MSEELDAQSLELREAVRTGLGAEYQTVIIPAQRLLRELAKKKGVTVLEAGVEAAEVAETAGKISEARVIFAALVECLEEDERC